LASRITTYAIGLEDSDLGLEGPWGRGFLIIQNIDIIGLRASVQWLALRIRNVQVLSSISGNTLHAWGSSSLLVFRVEQIGISFS